MTNQNDKTEFCENLNTVNSKKISELIDDKMLSYYENVIIPDLYSITLPEYFSEISNKFNPYKDITKATSIIASPILSAGVVISTPVKEFHEEINTKFPRKMRAVIDLVVRGPPPDPNIPNPPGVDEEPSDNNGAIHPGTQQPHQIRATATLNYMKQKISEAKTLIESGDIQGAITKIKEAQTRAKNRPVSANGSQVIVSLKSDLKASNVPNSLKIWLEILSELSGMRKFLESL